MTHLCCPDCRLRFSAEAAAQLTACPECGAQALWVEGAQPVLGFRLFDPCDVADVLPDGPELPPAPPAPTAGRL